jgi:H+-transporting ATPase
VKSLPLGQLFELLGVDEKKGLTSDEVRSRTTKFGFNEIQEKRKNLFLLFLKKFWGMSAWMIEAIAILSLCLHKRSDFYVAAGLLVVNAVIGFFQERRAQHVVTMLQSKLQDTVLSGLVRQQKCKNLR